LANQFGEVLRNQMATSLSSALSNGVIKLFSGAAPVDCQAADPAGELASGILPAIAATALSGVVSKFGSWLFTGSAAGNALSFRVYDSSLVCIHQGTVSVSGMGGDMIIDTIAINPAQAGEVTGYAVTIGGA
jgi:hypothetical protein